MLRVSFDTTIRSSEASFDIQYGYVKRNTHRNTSWDMAKFESAAHKYVDLSGYDYGVALMNDCKYGHKVLDSVIDLNILRSRQIRIRMLIKMRLTHWYTVCCLTDVV